MTNLTLIPTPIGNREDITIRALKSLFSVDILLCEDTRLTKKLLFHYMAKYPDILATVQPDAPKIVFPYLEAFHEHNELEKIPYVLTQLNLGKNVGLVSDAGTPAISDPGYKLIRKCWQKGIPVCCLPGANAAVTAVAACGLPTDSFLYLGFLSRKDKKQQELLRQIFESKLGSTVVIYESGQRLGETLKNIQTVFGDVRVVVAKELTKIHETYYNLTLDEWFNNPPVLKGELVLLFNPNVLQN